MKRRQSRWEHWNELHWYDIFLFGPCIYGAVDITLRVLANNPAIATILHNVGI